VTWWCSATGEAWSWSWRGYPGVWLLVALLALWYWRALRRSAGGPIRPSPWFITGLLCIWLSLDWPIGTLGAGYLASVHTVTYILLALVAPPCLILGLPRPGVLRAISSPIWGPVLRLTARPLFALVLFNGVLLSTHVPAVVDGLMASQIGAFAIDTGWLLGGMALWWPVMGPPELVTMRRPMKMAYLFASTLLPIIPSAFLTFAEYPLYATYELAPRVVPILTAQQDQQVAGLLMKVVGDLPIWFAFGVIFFRWARESTTTPPPPHPDSLRPAGRTG
jgi:putative membrane protein